VDSGDFGLGPGDGVVPYLASEVDEVGRLILLRTEKLDLRFALDLLPLQLDILLLGVQLLLVARYLRGHVEQIVLHVVDLLSQLTGLLPHLLQLTALLNLGGLKLVTAVLDRVHRVEELLLLGKEVCRLGVGAQLDFANLLFCNLVDEVAFNDLILDSEQLGLLRFHLLQVLLVGRQHEELAVAHLAALALVRTCLLTQTVLHEDPHASL